MDERDLEQESNYGVMISAKFLKDALTNSGIKPKKERRSPVFHFSQTEVC